MEILRICLEVSHKVTPDDTFNIAKNPKYDGYQCGLASIVSNFFKKNLAVLLKVEL